MLPRPAAVTQTLVAFRAIVALLRPRGELEFPRTATSGSGERGASSSNGAGSGGGGSAAAIAKERAVGYLRGKERKQGGADVNNSDRPRSRLAEAAAEFTESQQAFMLSSPSGLGVGAEAAIAQAIKDGSLHNLAGTGKPLRQEDHSAQFSRVDPLVQAATRTMGAQNVRPLSLELRDELQRELAALRAQLASELEAAAVTAASKAPRVEYSSSGDSSSGGDADVSSKSLPGWFSRFLGTGSGEAGGASTHVQRHTVESIRAGRHEGLQHAAECAKELTREYNSAVLSDKETYGAAWPLEQAKQLDWGAEVDAVLQEMSGISTAGTASTADCSEAVTKL